jgi:16S rRNA (adenine1518-N6/adenine1519-N6)-dimethyltransferase
MGLLAQTKELARIFNIHPNRSKGQNFLVDESVYDDMIRFAKIPAGATVLEAGPGFGFLTARLSEVASRVIAVEMDDGLAEYIKTALDSSDNSNVELIHDDVMSLGEDQLSDISPYQVVSNLPYQISSIFLRKFLTASYKPSSLTLMLQKEVAERIIAKAPDMNMLAFSVQYYGTPKVERIVSAGSFWPEPVVESAIIRIDVDQNWGLSKEDEKILFRILKFAFSAKRKMLKNNLSAGLQIKPSDIGEILVRHEFNEKVRAENLNISDWLLLFADLKPFVL